uniref:Uncharacterized protein n=1 Tax=Cucumis melo TaxID=3656 RepID=A0A9I9E696_CUCME
MELFYVEIWQYWFSSIFYYSCHMHSAYIGTLPHQLSLVQCSLSTPNCTTFPPIHSFQHTLYYFPNSHLSIFLLANC